MPEWVLVLTLLGISVGLILVFAILWKLVGGWSRIHACVKGDKEETAQLTKNGHYSANGYISSESDIALDLSGNYKHYDNVGNDLKLLATIENKETVISSSPKSNGHLLAAQETDQEDALLLEKCKELKQAMSCDSIQSGNSVIAESPHHCGDIEIGLEYDAETEDLIVIINRARDLMGPIPNYVLDSYIKVFLLPDKNTNMQTRIYRRSNNPVFEERFLFGVDEQDLSNRTLLCTVYAVDKSGHSMLGEAEVPLSSLTNLSHTSWVPILDSNQGPAELGDIMFSLSYLPTAERLTIVIVKCRNLWWEKSPQSTEFNPFVKVYLLQNGNTFAKKKTSVKKNDRDPNFNEAMIFSVPSNVLQSMQLRVTVSDYQNSSPVGHVFVGPYCRGKSLSHWNQMMSSLRKPVSMWHPLGKLSSF